MGQNETGRDEMTGQDGIGWVGMVMTQALTTEQKGLLVSVSRVNYINRQKVTADQSPALDQWLGLDNIPFYTSMSML